MKKILWILVLLMFLGLCMQGITNFFIKERESEYVVNNYRINEKLKVVEDTENYDFLISNKKNNVFILSIEENFNKQKKIIEDIKEYKEGNLKCIYPVYKRGYVGDITCLYDGMQVSYSYLKQIGNSDVEKIIDRLKKDGISNSKWNKSEKKSEVLEYDSKKIEVYQDNILDGYTFLIWRYKGLYILNKKKSEVKDFLEFDQYDNAYSALVGKYYVVADVNPDNEALSELSYYNTKELGKDKMQFPDVTSIKYYFNGVIDNELYITDVGLGKQYIVNPYKDKIKELNAGKDKFISLENGKKVFVDAEELLKEEVYFTMRSNNKELSKLYPKCVDIKEVREYYYFITSDGSVLRVNKNNLEKAELLFTFDNISEWIVKDGDILVVTDDMVYFYSDEAGLLPIARNSELKYNHKNICDFWKS